MIQNKGSRRSTLKKQPFFNASLGLNLKGTHLYECKFVLVLKKGPAHDEDVGICYLYKPVLQGSVAVVVQMKIL